MIFCAGPPPGIKHDANAGTGFSAFSFFSFSPRHSQIVRDGLRGTSCVFTLPREASTVPEPDSALHTWNLGSSLFTPVLKYRSIRSAVYGVYNYRLPVAVEYFKYRDILQLPRIYERSKSPGARLPFDFDFFLSLPHS